MKQYGGDTMGRIGRECGISVSIQRHIMQGIEIIYHEFET